MPGLSRTFSVIRHLAPLAALLTIGAGPPAKGAHWTGSWAAAQQPVERSAATAPVGGAVFTIRQLVRLTKGGPRLRLRFSNSFGSAPLTIDAVRVARARRPGNAAIDARSTTDVRFGGAQAVTIPAGADYWSDPVELPMAALSTLAVSLRTTDPDALATGHIASHATSYVAPGDQSASPDLAGAVPVEHWFALSGVFVESADRHGAVVALGDSITDGSHSTTDGNDRWPDRLAERLQQDPRTRGLGVLNLGIGGNRVLLDGVGPNALARFERDVLAQPGVRLLVLLEGVNDLGTLTRDGPVAPTMHAVLVGRLIQAYRQMIDRAHQHGIRVIGATILPFAGALSYHPDASNEADRQAINRWIREPGHFDGVLDFDRALRDPAAPARLLPGFDCGDHLHPSPAGYKAMADMIPLGLFE